VNPVVSEMASMKTRGNQAQLSPVTPKFQGQATPYIIAEPTLDYKRRKVKRPSYMYSVQQELANESSTCVSLPYGKREARAPRSETNDGIDCGMIAGSVL
jgi:hypothetical protein